MAVPKKISGKPTCNNCSKELKVTRQDRTPKFCSHACCGKFYGTKHIDNIGKVPWNKNKRKVVINTEGYRQLWDGGKYALLHRLVWIKHKGEIQEGFHIHHINGDKTDNRVENLQEVSNSNHGKLTHKLNPTQRLSLNSGRTNGMFYNRWAGEWQK